MSGRRRDFDGTFSQEHIKFWQTDPRIRGTKSTLKVFVWYAGQIAVQERREVLPRHWDHKAIGNLCDLDPKTSAIALKTAKENSLIGQMPDGRLIVWGTAKRHANLPFKNTCINGVMQVHNPPIQYHKATEEIRGEESREEERREETTKDHPASPGSSKESQNLAKEFNRNGYLIGLIKAAWKLRFGSAQHPDMARFRQRCENRGISPIRVLNYTREHWREDPMKYLQSLVSKGKGMWPDVGDESYVDWSTEALEKVGQ